jgi:site-specific recombinase XerD
LFRVLKSHFEARALALESSEPVAAQQLRRASGHWLRHSFATNALQSGMPIDVVQKALGHASVSTTDRYLTSEARRIDEEMEKISSTMC